MTVDRGIDIIDGSELFEHFFKVSLRSFVDEFDMISQFSHFFFGAFCALVSMLFGIKSFIAVAIAYTLYSAIKEFWFDEKREAPIVRGSSVKDFVFQMLGFVVGAAIFFVALLVHL
jgi:VanZ family protein